MINKIVVKGFIEKLQLNEITEVREYEVWIEDHKSLISWFQNLCELDYACDAFTPCYIDSFQEVL